MTDMYLAPAKVNLHLAITDVLSNGYHALHTSFVYVDVYDELHISLADDLVVRCSNVDFDGEANLVYQVLHAFRRHYQITQGLSVQVIKNIPAQAGLGGGSSDAATALWVANQLWSIHLSRDELIKFSVNFGADIPCFLFGVASVAQGIGDVLAAYTKAIPNGFVVLAWPGHGVSTSAAFAHYDANEFNALTDEKAKAKVRARSAMNGFELGFNSLESSAVALCNTIALLLAAMREQAESVWMSGSGSACVAICDTGIQARQMAVELKRRKLASWVHVGRFLPVHPLQGNKNIGA